MTDKKKEPIYEQKCPACGAMLRFDAASGKLVCDYCGTILEVEKEKTKEEIKTESKEEDGKKKKAASGKTVDEQVSRLLRDKELSTMEPLPVYNCVSCGAELIAPPESGALTCPYCKNNIVLTEQFSGNIKPDGIIPFKISSKELPGAIRSFYKDKPLLAREFFTKNRIGKVTGIYVPFWLFDCETNGEVHYHAEKLGKTYRSGDYLITETDEYRLERGMTAAFEDLAVDASKKLDDALMDSVGPFDCKELVPFDQRYLAGFVADRFDLTSEAVQNRNDVRVKNTMAELAKAQCTAGFYGVSIEDTHASVNIKRARYVLLPVYLVDVEYGGKTYHFAVNGQSGKVTGELPRDLHVNMLYALRYFAVGFAAMAAVIAAICVI